MGYSIEPGRHEAIHEGRPGVGYVGCPRDGGGLLRVRVGNFRRQRIRVACPRCPSGTIHETERAEGRPLRDGETPPELVELPVAEDAPTAPAEPPAPPRQRYSDAEIIAAVTTEARPAIEVARALGYGKSSSLLSRIRRMNAAAGSPLVEIVRDGSRLALRLPADPVDSVTENPRPHDAGDGSDAEGGPV